MPKKRQYGGIIGATPQTAMPINPFIKPLFGGSQSGLGGNPAGTPPGQASAQTQGNAYYNQMANAYAARGDAGSAALAKGMTSPLSESEANLAKQASWNRAKRGAAMEGELEGIKQGAAQGAAGGRGEGAGSPHPARPIVGDSSIGGREFALEHGGPNYGSSILGGHFGHGKLRSVVTGGYGASPAREGRIGYRGALKEKGLTGLAAHYARQRDTMQSKTAQKAIDPVTGMSYTPTDKEIDAQLAMIGDKYGPREQAMLRDYYTAGRTGDFAKQKAAADAIQARKAEINKPKPLPIAPTNTGGQNPNGIPVDDALNKVAGLASGGNAEQIQPYIVNEKGEEAWQPKGEEPQLIPGKEKMVLFPKDGKVIPHGRTMQMAKKGQVKMPENRESGGQTKGLSQRKTYAQRKEAARQASLKAFNKALAEKLTPDDINALRASLNKGENFPTGNLATPKASSPFLAGIGSVPVQPSEEYLSPIDALMSLNPDFKDSLAAYAEMGGQLPESYLRDWAATQFEDNVQPVEQQEQEEAEQDEPLPLEVPPASPEEMEALAKEQSTPPPVVPAPMPVMKQTGWSKGEQPALIGEAMKPSPQVQKPTSIYTPEEEALLAQGANMTARGLSEMGPRGVKFATGGGIDETGKAFGPNVVSQPQKPVTIRPGKVKDEQGDVGTRLAKEKENKKFMKRWESDLASDKAPETEKEFKKPLNLQDGGQVVKTPVPFEYMEPKVSPSSVVPNPSEKYRFGQNVSPYDREHKKLIDSILKGEGNMRLAPLAPGDSDTWYVNRPHLPRDKEHTFRKPEALNEAIQQQAEMEQYAQQAMAARNQRRGRTAKYAK